MSHTASIDAGFAVGSDRAVVQRWFAGLLLAVTTLPFVLVPLVMGTALSAGHGAVLVFSALLVTGAHQQSSWYLYADRDSRRIAAAHRLFFFAGPVAIAVACAGFFVYAPSPLHSYFWIAFGVLSIHHYQSQNLGIFSLLSPLLGGARMAPIERKLLRAGGICGMLVFGYPLGRTVLEGTPLVPLEPWLRTAAAVGLLGLGAVTAFVALRPAPGTEARAPARGLVLLLLVTYFWPLLLIEQPLTAFAMFAGGHGLQYLVIMSFVAANNDRAREVSAARPRLRGLLAALAVAVFGGVTWLIVSGMHSFGSVASVIGPAASADDSVRMAGALVLSTTLIHYWVDARMWKMSQPDSRQFMRRKLAFLF